MAARKSTGPTKRGSPIQRRAFLQLSTAVAASVTFACSSASRGVGAVGANSDSESAPRGNRTPSATTAACRGATIGEALAIRGEDAETSRPEATAWLRSIKLLA
jgi:hypothetical protein